MQSIPKHIFIFILAAIIGAGCFLTGMELSLRRPLWNDELFTQTVSIEKRSYTDIIRGAVPEGNNSPLFYVMQKGVCDIGKYRFPLAWDKQWYLHDVPSQKILRMVSNVAMSLSIAILFYVVARFYSIGLGLLAGAIVLSMPMVWMYWVEGRPYALWFLLTTLQSALFLCLINRWNKSALPWGWLGLVHLLMSLTIAFSGVQVILASGLLWLFTDRRWKKYLFLAVVPLGMNAFYYVQSPKYHFWFRESPLQLVLDAVPLEYGVLLLIYLGTAGYLYWMKKKEAVQAAVYFLWMTCLFLAVAAVLTQLKWHEKDNPVGFAISSRYFIFLIPVTVIALAAGTADAMRNFKKDSWMRVNIYIILGGALSLRIAKTIIEILASGTFKHII